MCIRDSFRTGDVVVLYERNHDSDNVTNQMVFKGNIEQITDTELRIRLRATPVSYTHLDGYKRQLLT